MPTINYPYLVEGTTFDAASLNTRFGPVGAVGFGINALMGYAAKRGCFQEEHLPETGIVAAEDFTVTNLTLSINPANDEYVDTIYTTWGGNNDRQVITDGVTPLQFEVGSGMATSIALGMGNPDKIAGLLILANVHFMCTLGQGDYAVKEGPTGFMICVQYKDGAGGWNTIRASERFCNERIVKWASAAATAEGNPLGDGPFEGGPDLGASVLSRPDIYTFQDLPLRFWLDQANFPNEIFGLRIVGTSVAFGSPIDPVASWIPRATGNMRAYYREANFSVIPLHAEAL